MRRRRLLAALTSGALLPSLAGCEGLQVGSASPATETLTPAPVNATGSGTAGGVPPRTPRETRTAYRASDPSENLPEALGFAVRSRLERAQSLRIRVFDGDRSVYNEAMEVEGGDTVNRGDVIRRRGRYRVLVETYFGDGSEASTFDWRVREGYGNLKIELTPAGVEMEQRVECSPECSPLSREGKAASLPYVGDSTPLLDPAWIDVENVSSTTKTATIQVTDGTTTVLDYTYDVPPGLRPSVPAVASDGTYDVTVRGETATREYEWVVPQQPRLRVRLGDVPRIDCGEAVGTMTVENQDEDRHAVTVTVERDGQRRYEKSVELYGGEIVALSNVVESAGLYRIRAESESGGVATRNWWVCEGSSRAAVEVEVTGLVTIDTVFRY